MKNGIINLNHTVVLRQIQAEATKYFTIKLGKVETPLQRKQREEGMQLMQQYQSELLPIISYTIKDGTDHIVEDAIEAKLEFTLEYKEIKVEGESQQFLLYLLQISFLDSVRDYIKTHWFPTMMSHYYGKRERYISPIVGVGLYEEPLKNIGVQYGFEGALYATKIPWSLENPCKWCKSKSGCEYCMIYAHNKWEKGR